MDRTASYENLLRKSLAVNWKIDDILGAVAPLDFRRPFLPEAFVRAEDLPFLTPVEKLALNQIRGRGYLALFELFEQCVAPFVSEQSRLGSDADGAAFRAPALRQFVREENKHRQMFTRFLADFDEAFGSPCGFIGPAPDIVGAILAHGEMAVTIAVLALEYMSQAHWLESARPDATLDERFKTMLEKHWLEEAQHAELDGLMLREMADRNPVGGDKAIDEFLDIMAFLDGGLAQQTRLDLAALEGATGRTLSEEERKRFVEVQHRALHWTFIGSAMSNPAFLSAVEAAGPTARARIEAACAATVH